MTAWSLLLESQVKISLSFETLMEEDDWNVSRDILRFSKLHHKPGLHGSLEMPATRCGPSSLKNSSSNLMSAKPCIVWFIAPEEIKRPLTMV